MDSVAGMSLPTSSSAGGWPRSLPRGSLDERNASTLSGRGGGGGGTGEVNGAGGSGTDEEAVGGGGGGIIPGGSGGTGGTALPATKPGGDGGGGGGSGIAGLELWGGDGGTGGMDMGCLAQVDQAHLAKRKTSTVARSLGTHL